ncbi:MAG: response regulator transcription factor [bacterium]|nr:response regulator transcription factor [bacterium]
MARESVLIIEDEEDIQELINYSLSKEGYLTTAVISGEDGLKTAKSKQPNLIVLDLMLPGMDGLEICRLLKNDPKTQHIPIVMLTAKGEESDVITGLELGADDYITKPFSPKVLVARIRTILRRKVKHDVGDEAVLSIHEMTIHPGRHEVVAKGKQVDLTLTEFKILHLLARRPGWVYTRYQIVNEIRGDEVLVTDRAVDVQIVGLRRKLGVMGKYVETVRGVGYRFKE